MLNLQIIGEVVLRGLFRDDSEETNHHAQENLAAARSPEVASEIVFATIPSRSLDLLQSWRGCPSFGNCCNISLVLKKSPSWCLKAMSEKGFDFGEPASSWLTITSHPDVVVDNSLYCTQ
jgi:hypothetical protein